MAKGNMFQGMARGSVGDVTFYRFNGQQASRVRNRQPKNPKSDGQIVQRVILSTLGKLYSLLKPICNHSFEGLSTGLECSTEFQKVNQSKIRELLASGVDLRSFAAKNSNLPISVMGQEYVVARGSLQKPFRYYVNPDENVAGIILYQGAAPAEGTTLTLTYQSIVDYMGLQLGDQLTFARFVDRVGDNDPGSYGWAFNRLVLFPDGGDQTESFADGLTSASNASVSLNSPNQRNLLRNVVPGEVAPDAPQILRWIVSEGQGTLYLPLIQYQGLQASQPVPAYFTILTRKAADGNYLYSDAVIEYTDLMDDLTTAAIANNQVFTLSQAISSWKDAAGTSTVNENYLDNAGLGGAPIVPGGEVNNG